MSDASDTIAVYEFLPKVYVLELAPLLYRVIESKVWDFAIANNDKLPWWRYRQAVLTAFEAAAQGESDPRWQQFLERHAWEERLVQFEGLKNASRRQEADEIFRTIQFIGAVLKNGGNSRVRRALEQRKQALAEGTTALKAKGAPALLRLRELYASRVLVSATQYGIWSAGDARAWEDYRMVWQGHPIGPNWMDLAEHAILEAIPLLVIRARDGGTLQQAKEYLASGSHQRIIERRVILAKAEKARRRTRKIDTELRAILPALSRPAQRRWTRVLALDLVDFMHPHLPQEALSDPVETLLQTLGYLAFWLRDTRLARDQVKWSAPTPLLEAGMRRAETEIHRVLGLYVAEIAAEEGSRSPPALLSQQLAALYESLYLYEAAIVFVKAKYKRGWEKGWIEDAQEDYQQQLTRIRPGTGDFPLDNVHLRSVAGGRI